MASWTNQIKELLTTLSPGWLKPIIEKGLLKTAVASFAIVLVLPPLVVLLAAFSLQLLGTLDNRLVRALREEYLRVIEKGFSIDAVAARSNINLDYLQLFEHDLRPKLAPSKELRLSLKPWQKARILFRTIVFTADDPLCTLPESDFDLVTVSLGDQSIRTLGAESNITIDIGRQWWTEHANKFGDDDLVERLSFRLTERARQLTCGRVHVEGTVEVFKDILATL